MSKTRKLRKKVKKLESNFSELFALVSTLVEIQAQHAEGTRSMASAVGSAVGAHLATIVAMNERNEAAREGLNTYH